ncbi:hypothetical protein BHM03_00039104 [Ensete ventricosum]|nr:hypothetical protein BHM03_00039104 [Ensete ventricosum]
MARGRPPGGVAARAARDGGNRPSMTEIDRRRPILVLPPGSGRSAYRSAAGPNYSIYISSMHQLCNSVRVSMKNILEEELYLDVDFLFSGSRTDWYYSSILVEDIVEMVCIDKTLSAEREMELSDLSSSNKQIIDLGLVSEIGTSDRAETLWGGLEYVKEILTISEFIVDDLIPYFMDQSDEIFDPLLFEKLEENQSLTACEIAERHRRMRKIIFDAVNECLETKHSHYFRAGFRMWSKGVVLAAKDLSHELYNEISGWNSIEDLMVDELVAKDMSTYLGRWIDFEIEAFEAGVEIQMWLFNTLVDEVVADFQINDPQDI